MPTEGFEPVTVQFLRLTPLPLGYVGLLKKDEPGRLEPAGSGRKLREEDSNLHRLGQSQTSCQLEDPEMRGEDCRSEPGATRTRDLKLRKLALSFR